MKTKISVVLDVAMLEQSFGVAEDETLRRCMIAAAAEAVARALAAAERGGFSHKMASVASLRLLAVESELGPARVDPDPAPEAGTPVSPAALAAMLSGRGRRDG